MKDPRVIFVFEYPPDERDVRRYGFLSLMSAGLQVESWDLSQIFLPRSRGKLVSVSTPFKPIVCSSASDVRGLTTKLSSFDTVVFVGCLSASMMWRGRKVLSAFGKSHAWLTALSVGGMPSAIAERQRRSKSLASRLGYLTSPTRWLQVPERALSMLLNRVLSLKPLAQFLGARPLDQVWADTSITGIACGVLSQRTELTFIHALDYDLVMDVRPQVKTGGWVVFIDSLGPGHPDYSILGISPNLTIEEFQESILSGLDALARATGLQVVIAAHPRSLPGQVEEMYSGYRVFHGATARLVAESALVACAEGSTAIGIAVALHKPLVLMTSLKFHETVRRANDVIEIELKPLILDLDGNLEIGGNPSIDVDSYDLFTHRYMKLPGTLELPFWSVVSRNIKTRLSKFAF